MGEDSSHAERSSSNSSSSTTTTTSSPTGPAAATTTSPHQQPQPQPQQQPENPELLIPSFSPSCSAPTSPVSTLSRLGLRSPSSSGASPGSPSTTGGQVSAITVVALLDKLVNMLEAVQENQRRMEQRQAELEGAVRGVQGDVTRLSKSHTSTSNSVSKLLERSRKVSGHMKEVKERMDKQAVQVKRLEANHTHLLKRNHFKVLIFQEDNEIPSSVFVKDTLKSPQPCQMDPEAFQPAPSVTGSTNGNRCQDEALQTISLSSDEDDAIMGNHDEEEILEADASFGLATALPAERTRAEKLKRSSLKKVDSLKKAFSRQSIEKKMNKIGTKIVPLDRREKIKKSLTPNHPKSPTSKSSSFKVSPMTFNVKKVRDGEVPMQDGGSPGDIAHVEIPPLGRWDEDLPLAENGELPLAENGELPLAEVHSQEGLVEDGGEMPSSSTLGNMKVELSVNGEVESVDLNGIRPAGLAVPEHDEEEDEEEEEYEEDEVVEEAAAAAAAEKHPDTPVEVVAEPPISTATIAVQQVA